MAFATEEFIKETLSVALQILTDEEDGEEEEDIACILVERDRSVVRMADVTNARDGIE